MEGDVYTVTVANPSGAITRETRISVIRSPQIIKPPEQNYRIFTGSPFNITVNATGGFVYYIWHRDGNLIQVRFDPNFYIFYQPCLRILRAMS